MQRLPLEIRLHILSYLPLEERLAPSLLNKELYIVPTKGNMRNVVDLAMKLGNLNFLGWLLSIVQKTSELTRQAARDGQVEVLKYLHEIYDLMLHRSLASM